MNIEMTRCGARNCREISSFYVRLIDLDLCRFHMEQLERDMEPVFEAWGKHLANGGSTATLPMYDEVKKRVNNGR